MIAAIYGRKGTDQNIADEEKSVARQAERARAKAAPWLLDHVHTELPTWMARDFDLRAADVKGWLEHLCLRELTASGAGGDSLKKT